MSDKKEQDEVFKDIYGNYDPEQLLVDGKKFLDSNLKLKAKKHSRLFLMVFWVVAAVGVGIGVLVLVYLLERSHAMAESFEKSREMQLKKYEDTGDG